MVDPNRWQPLQLEHMISQNGIPVDERRPAGRRAALGSRHGLRPARRRRGRRPDRSRAAAAARRPGHRPGVQGPGRRGHPRQQPARPGRRRDDRHLARRARRQQPLGTNDGHGPRGQPGDRPAVRRRTSSTAATSRACWPSSGRTARSRRRRPATGTSSPTTSRTSSAPNLRIGGAGPAGRPPRVGRQAVPRAQRRRARRGDRRLGPQGLLRLGPADLDDPVHGRARPVERPDGCRPTTRRGCRSSPASIEVDHAGDDRRRASATRRSPATRARSPSGPGRATRTTRRPQIGGVGWILAVDWVPYQLPTFVTPAFPGYVSGHSTFSRAAAEVLTGFTGSEYFPGGLERVDDQGRRRSSSRSGPTHRRHASSGRPTTTPPTRPASRASTAASTSRPTTSTAGSSAPQCGKEAWALAQQYYDGSRRVSDRPRPSTRPGRSRDRAGGVARRRRRRRGGRRRRRRASLVRPGDARRPRSGRRASSRRRPRPASTTRYDGRLPVPGRRRRGRVRLRRRRPARTSTSPAASGPAALYRNDSPVGGALRFDARSRDPATDLTSVNGAYPLDIDGDGRSTSPSCGSARTSSCAASATAGSSAPTRRSGFDGGRRA